MNVTSLRSNSEQQAVSAEIRIAKVAIINVTLWIMAWSPFAIICMLGTWGDVSKITPLVNELPCILAKTSCAYNPVIYALSHPKYREVILPNKPIIVANYKMKNLIYLFEYSVLLSFTRGCASLMTARRRPARKETLTPCAPPVRPSLIPQT